MLANVVPALFGKVGSILLAAIFVVACLNVCVGLICSCGEYFAQIFPRISYRTWAVVFAVVSMLIANAGLDLILKISVPVLEAIYPVAIMLIILSFLDRWLDFDRVWPVTIAFTGVFSVLFALKGIGVPLNILNFIPLAGVGLGWVLPAGIGIVVGILVSSPKA